VIPVNISTSPQPDADPQCGLPSMCGTSTSGLPKNPPQAAFTTSLLRQPVSTSVPLQLLMQSSHGRELVAAIGRARTEKINARKAVEILSR